VQSVRTDVHANHGAVDHLHIIFQIAPPHLPIKGEAVDLKRKHRWYRGSFVDNIGAIFGMIDIGLEIVSEAVLRIVLFDQITTEPEFKQEIYGDFHKRFTHDRPTLMGSLDHGDLQVGLTHPQVGRRQLACGPAPMTRTSVVIVSIVVIQCRNRVQ
jgi:hypothetical protein